MDDTAELDRVLQAGHAATASSLAARLRPTVESASSGSDTDSSTRSTRPKLTEALHRVAAFSPKRPRSAQSIFVYPNQNSTRGAGPSTYTYQRSNSSPPKATFNGNDENNPTPKPRPKRTATQQPEVMVQPPTPSTAGSKFTKMARGLARDIEAEQRRIWGAAVKRGDGDGGTLAQSTVRERKLKSQGGEERNPFNDIGNSLGAGVRERKSTTKAPEVHLPDVTGLTSAIASPAKNGLDYHGYEYEGGEEPRDAEGTLRSSISEDYLG